MKLPIFITRHPLYKRAADAYFERLMVQNLHKALDHLIAREGCTRFIIVGGKIKKKEKNLVQFEVKLSHNFTDQGPQTWIQVLEAAIRYIEAETGTKRGATQAPERVSRRDQE